MHTTTKKTKCARNFGKMPAAYDLHDCTGGHQCDGKCKPISGATGKLTMRETKTAILRDWHEWSQQTGPGDQRGYEADQRTLLAVKSARSWDALAAVAPRDWTTAVVNRCHRDQM